MSRKAFKYAAVIASLLLTAVFAGCGSSNREGGATQGGDPLLGGVATVGDTTCFQCHSANADPLTGETFIEQYQRSLHAELGCESCHGGGAQHFGIGPFPFELNSGVSDAQKAARCDDCHNGTTVFQGKLAPLTSSPNFENGNHANPFSEEEAHEARCARCHSHEGSILYGQEGFTGDASLLTTDLAPILARNPETFNTIRCATCHEHGGNVRQTKTRDAAGNIVTWDPNGNKVIDQVDLCTSCHTYTTNFTTKTGKLIGSGNVLQIYTSNAVTSGPTGFKNVTTAAFFHNTAWYRTVTSTHYDQPASGTTSSGTIIEGYVFRTTAQTRTPCFDCHGHEFQTNTRKLDPAASASVQARPDTIFLDWGRSAHAGRLLNSKIAAAAATTSRTTAQVDAVMAAGVRDTPAKFSAWGHYNWDDTASRGVCQRCHTTTGAANFLNNPTGYDATGNSNSFTHLSGWTNSNKRSPQQELLYCWGCHSNAGTGQLRNPGAVTITYDSGARATTVTYPDIANSNVCLACHTGRETGDNIKLDQDPDGVLNFINSHYLTAGGTLFATTGYEYAGRSYENPAFFQHDKIGTAAAPGTGSSGPCAGCHMTSPNKHRFTNVSSSGGVIAKITSTICVTCHTGQSALTAADLATEEEDYEAALSALDAALAAKGIFFFSGANPYFFTAPFVVGGTNTNYTNWAGPYGFAFYKDVMGAAFNLNLLAHDPGGFAHNRFYAKRLIWDSLDFIDDGILNNSVPATLTAVLPAGQTLTDAQTYLGATRP